MRIIAVKDYNELSRATASLIAAQVVSKPDSVLGLATGSSPIGTYQKLIEWYKAGALDFSACSTLNLDEYVGLTKDNDQSYAYFMRTNLFDHINIKPENLNIPDGMNPDAAGECARYDAVIEKFGGADLQLLGIGRNGHIGFNEPGAAFVRNTNCVQLTQSTIDANKRFFAREEDVPRKAYTMGIGGIMLARKVVLIASGADKADAVAKSFFGPITPEVPASILQLHRDFVLVADEAALANIPRMNRLFDPQNFFFQALSWTVDLVGISLFWMILCLPVVTIVPATAALYHTAALCMRTGAKGAFTRFFRSFLGNLKQGCLLSVPLVILGAILFWGQNVMAAASTLLGGSATALYGVYSVALVLPLGAVCWMIPLLGRFDFGSRELVRVSFVLTVGHLFTTIGAIALVCAAAFLCLLILPLVLILPSIAAVFLSLLLERVFRRYLPEDHREPLSF